MGFIAAHSGGETGLIIFRYVAGDGFCLCAIDSILLFTGNGRFLTCLVGFSHFAVYFFRLRSGNGIALSSIDFC